LAGLPNLIMRLLFVYDRTIKSLREQQDLVLKFFKTKSWQITLTELYGRPKEELKQHDVVFCVNALLASPIGCLMRYYTKSCYVWGTLEGQLQPNWLLVEQLKALKVLAVSNFVKDCLAKDGIETRAVIQHGLDFEVFNKAKNFKIEQSPPELKPLIRQLLEKPYFLTVAGSVYRKRLDLYAKALQSLAKSKPLDYNFLLITQLNRAYALWPALRRALLKVENLFIIDADFNLPRAFLDWLYHGCYAYINPSQAEGFGLTVLEAMAAGKPVITCLYPPIDELVSPEIAFTFYPGKSKSYFSSFGQIWQLGFYQAKDLATAIEQAMNEPKEVRRKGRKALREAKKFDYRQLYEAFCDVFEADLGSD